MLETIGLFFAGWLFTWQALVLVLVVGIFFEHTASRGLAVFSGIVAMVISYFYFEVSLQTIAYAAVGYLIVGVIWSFWRYNVFVSDRMKELRSRSWTNLDHYTTATEGLAPSRNLKRITAWIIIWPFSAVENILGDIITMIQTLVTKVFKGVYYKIYTSHLQAPPPNLKEL